MSACFYLDTNIFITALQDSGENAAFAQDALRLLLKHPGMGVTSEMTLAELLVKDDLVSRRTVDRLLRGRLVTLRPISRAILINSAMLRRTTRFKLPDAIHAATAIDAQCQYLLSYDKDMDRVPKPLLTIKPDAVGIAVLKQALA